MAAVRAAWSFGVSTPAIPRQIAATASQVFPHLSRVAAACKYGQAPELLQLLCLLTLLAEGVDQEHGCKCIERA